MSVPKTSFPVSGYFGPAYFCDREQELAQLKSYIDGGVPAVIIGIRRLGKTGLIRHLFHHLKMRCLFVDLQGTESFQQLVEKLAESVSYTLPESKYRRVWNLLKALHPSVSFDPLTGAPQFGFNFQNSEEANRTFRGLLAMLEGQNEDIVIALDEFQQILSYPEKDVEGLLRAEIQQFPRLKFLFSGSQTHLLSRMFTDGSKPFFSSVQRLYLSKLSSETYRDFIVEKFRQAGKTIHPDLVTEILDWTECHTYFTQYFCNQLFLESGRQVKPTEVKELKWKILQVSKQDYFQWRDVLASGQWRFIVAVAKEQNLYRPTSKGMMQRYRLGTPAAVKKALSMLLDKQLINEFFDPDGHKYYKLADVFMMRFIQSEIK